MDSVAGQPRLLIINPNSSAAVSAGLRATADSYLNGRAACTVLTCENGPAYLGDPESLQAGREAVYEKIKAALFDAGSFAGESFDAVVLGCFADLGIAQIATMSGRPAYDLLSAALHVTNTLDKRFSIVTAGRQWEELLPGMIVQLAIPGTKGKLCSVRTIEMTGTMVANAPTTAMDMLSSAIETCVQFDGAEAIIVGGAGLAGMAQALSKRVTIPLIDSVVAALSCALGDYGARCLRIR